MEIWKDVIGFEGIYQVSNMGQIKSLERYDRRGFKKWPTRILKPAKTRYGYHQILLCKNGQRFKRYVHHIVTEAFIGERPAGKQCNHINGIKTDNSIDNLEYCTASENHYHSYQVLGKKAARGNDSGHNKLVESQVIFIRTTHLTGKELAKMFNVSRAVISNIRNYKIWKHIAV